MSLVLALTSFVFLIVVNRITGKDANAVAG